MNYQYSMLKIEEIEREKERSDSISECWKIIHQVVDKKSRLLTTKIRAHAKRAERCFMMARKRKIISALPVREAQRMQVSKNVSFGDGEK